MTGLHRVDRRTLLADLGRGALAVAALDVQRILFGHGDPLERDAAPALRGLVASR